MDDFEGRFSRWQSETAGLLKPYMAGGSAMPVPGSVIRLLLLSVVNFLTEGALDGVAPEVSGTSDPLHPMVAFRNNVNADPNYVPEPLADEPKVLKGKSK